MEPEARRRRPDIHHHPLEVLLGLFGDVRPGEAVTVLLMMANVFLLLSAYYLLKVAREPLILLGGGAEVKSYASVGQSVLLVAVASGYGWLAARVGRLALMALVTCFFAANLIVFFGLGTRGAPLGVPFFLWVGIFNTVTIAQFWSFAADTYTDEQGKRLFPLIAIGSSVGAIAGAALAAPLIKLGSPFPLMLVAAGILMSTLGITALIHRRELAHAPASASTFHEEPLGRANAFGLVARDRYLLLIAILILILNIVTRTGDYVLDRTLVAQAPAAAHALGIQKAAYIGQFKARYFGVINVLGLLLQLFAVSRIIKYVGIRASLVLVPLASVVGYGTALVMPILGVLVVSRVVESTLDYTLSNTTRQTLWLVTSREAKYKAKQVVDTFVMRAGDALSACLVWVGVRVAMTTRMFLAINVALSLAWLAMSVLIGREHAKRSTNALSADLLDAAKPAEAPLITT
jgi:AAA family ATP:ADP antiporter